MAFIGIDTSNYTSSCAIAEKGQIIFDNRILLKVKTGSVGLRQSDALYQHWENLPIIMDKLFHCIKENNLSVDGIVVSTKPRPQENSYMPVFNAGKSIANILSDALSVPIHELSHQEAHILAASYGNPVDFSKEIVCAHLSGGTLELITVKNGIISIIGGTKDISYGQLIDRCGVLIGCEFPAGKYIDALAMSFPNKAAKSPFKKIYCKGTELNISGIETQIKNAIENESFSNEELAFYIMSDISDSFIKIIEHTGIKQVLVTGGVASSLFLRDKCSSLGYMFGRADLCSDNACGLALSEGKLPWLNQ